MATGPIDLLRKTLLPAYFAEREQLDRIDRWLRWEHDKPVTSSKATREHNELAERAQTPLGDLIVTATAQELYVEGHRRSNDKDDTSGWEAWQANGMDSRQISLHRAALGYGEAFASVFPGRTTLGEAIPVIRCHSPRRVQAFWEDPAEDDWPAVVLRMDPAKIVPPGSGEETDGFVARVYDTTSEWTYHVTADGEKITYVASSDHNVGVVPFVRYANRLDLEGRTPGDVEPFIPLLGRIDQTTFDRLVVQRYLSWKVRTISGMTLPDEDEDAIRALTKLSISDILVSNDPDTKFGTLAETSPDGFIKSTEFDLRMLAATSQTPVYEMLGDLINLSAEALVAARNSLARKVEERKHSFGKSHEQTLRLAARVMGDRAAATDWASQVIWKDTEGRSLGQAADALGKLATMLGVPVEILWEKIPGWTQTDVQRAKEMVEAGDSMTQLLTSLARQAESAA